MKPEKLKSFEDPTPATDEVVEVPLPVEEVIPETPVEEKVEEPVEAKPEPKKDNAKYFVTDTPKLNVRETPNGKIIKVIESGEEVVLGGKSEDKDWYKIKSPIQGYVMKKYIKKV